MALRQTLLYAIRSSDVTKISSLLTQCGCDDVNGVYGDHTAMTCALEFCPDDVIPVMLMSNDHFDVSAKNRSGRTALFEASKLGRDVIVTCLLMLGSDVNAQDNRGNTPLAIAAFYNRHTTASLLLEHGADVAAVDWAGETPLHCACAYGSQEVVDLLMEHGGSDVNRLNTEGKTPLFSCLPSAYNVQVKGKKLSEAVAIFRRVWRGGCDVSITHAQRPLHDRVVQKDLVGACLLMEACPSLVNTVDDKGLTPLELVVKRGCWEIATSMLLYGAPSPYFSLHTNSNTNNNNQAVSSSAPSSPLMHSGNATSPSAATAATAAASNGSHASNSSSQSSSSSPSMTVNEAVSAKTLSSNWHKLRFLRALLNSSFVTPSNLGQLVDLGLITHDLVDAVHAELGSEYADVVYENLKLSSKPGFDQTTSQNLSNAGLMQSLLQGEAESSKAAHAQAAVESVCTAVRQSSTLRHQCRLAVRRLLGTSLPDALPRLGLPQRVQNYVTLGVDMSQSSPLRTTELHVALAENDVTKAQQLLQDGVDVNLPLAERLPLTRVLDLLPSHCDVNADVSKDNDVTADVVFDKGDVCGLCGSHLSAEDSVDNMDSLLANRGIGGCADRLRGLNINGTVTGGSDVIEMLLRHGSSLTSKDPIWDTPLHVAVARGACVLQQLINAVIMLDQTADNDVVKLGQTADSDVIKPGQTADSDVIKPGQTADSDVIKPGQTADSDVVKLDQTEGESTKNCTGVNTTKTSCSPRACDVVALITGHTHRLGLTPLELALLRGDLDSLRLLLLWAVPPGDEDEAGQANGLSTLSANKPDMVLHPAESLSHEEGVGTEEIQVQENALSKLARWVGKTTGTTALHCAAAAGFPWLVEGLLAHGACLDTTDNQGHTPQDMADGLGQLHRQKLQTYIPQWYDEDWKTELRVWPLRKPRPFGAEHVLKRLNSSNGQ